MPNLDVPARDSFADLLARLDPTGSIVDLAERLITSVAAGTGDELTVRYGDLTDRRSQRLFRPLLACLARKSEEENDRPVNVYGGAMEFRRAGPAGPIRVVADFENRTGAVWLVLRRATAPPPPTSRGPATTLALADVFVPAVSGYRVLEGDFDLRRELTRLERVRAAGASEAVVVYCARVVEATGRHLLGSAGAAADREPNGLIRALDDYGHLPGEVSCCLKQLQALATVARHAARSVSAVEADVAFAVLVRWLHWAFGESANGPRLPAVTLPVVSAGALVPPELTRLIDAAATGDEIVAQLLGSDPGVSPALLTPVVPAAAVESLLDRDRIAAARSVLDLTLPRFPEDLRLLQLDGLYWSRLGRDERNVDCLRRAREGLERLRLRGRTSAWDDETFGILAGVYKRLATADPANAADWLRQSHRTYLDGWEQSGRTNDYLGINAASMGVLQGLPMEAAEIVAVRIRDRMKSLRDRLRAAGGPDRPLSYYDQVTWAEAELLLSNWTQAADLYRDAFARFAEWTMPIGVSTGQARRILDRLGKSDLADEILGVHER